MTTTGRRSGVPGPHLDRALAVVVVLSAVAVPWWVPPAALAATGAFVLGRRSAPGALVGVSIVAAALSGGVAATRRPESLPVLIGLVAGVAVLMAAADALGRLGAARARYREQGWQLADAVRREGLATVEAARVAERSRIAGEVHDSLGHDMALLAMQLSALQVQVRHGRLSEAAVTDQLVRLQAAAAAATERLHTTIELLEPDGAGSERPERWSVAVDELVTRAREAGVDIRLTGPDPALDSGTAVVGRTVLRIVAEVTTNAAKHAPGQPLELSVEVGRDTVRLTASNPRAAVGPAGPGIEPPAGSGRGLPSLAERVHVLGGWCRAEDGPGGFRWAAEIPLHGTPAGFGRPEPGTTSDEARSRGRDEVARRRRSLLLVPAGLLAASAAVMVFAFVVANLGSVLPRERFLALRVGQPQDVAESLLPPVQLPDAPQTVAEPSADCRYYEERVSFFERVTTFQVCFAGGTLVGATEIPAERSR